MLHYADTPTAIHGGLKNLDAPVSIFMENGDGWVSILKVHITSRLPKMQYS